MKEAVPANRPTWLERVLNVFTEVQAGEGRPALALLGSVFLVLCAYYLIKPAREGWLSVSVVAGLSKIEVKAYSSFLQAVLLIAAVAVYSRMAATLSRRRLIAVVTVVFAAELPLFYLMQPGLLATPVPYAGILFYLWVGIFNVFIVAMFWSFVADYYDVEEGRRLLPLVAIGATAGAVAGSSITSYLVGTGIFDTFDLLLLAILPLIAAALMVRGVAAEQGELSKDGPAAGTSDSSPWSLIGEHPYLLTAALLTVAFAWVASNGDNLLFGVVQSVLLDEATAAGLDEEALQQFTRERTTAFYGDLYFWVNLLALLSQAFLASRLLRYGGFTALIMFLPVVSVITYASIALFPTLAVIKALRVAESSSTYSVNNTARHVLWLPTTSEMKYKAKAAIDTTCVRFGDGLAAVTVLLGVRLLGVSNQSLIIFNVVLALCLVVLAFRLAREHSNIILAEDS